MGTGSSKSQQKPAGALLLSQRWNITITWVSRYRHVTA